MPRCRSGGDRFSKNGSQAAGRPIRQSSDQGAASFCMFAHMLPRPITMCTCRAVQYVDSAKHCTVSTY